MGYEFDEKSGIYSFVDVNGDIKFSCNKIGLIVTSGNIVKHGPAPQMAAMAEQMRQSGQMVNFIESETWDLLDLNRRTRDIPPDIN